MGMEFVGGVLNALMLPPSRTSILTQAMRVLNDRGKSYFAGCPRDAKGHCESGGGTAAPRKAPGSQMPPAVVQRLRSLGMVGTLPPADVPLSAITVNLKAGDAGALLSWKQTTKSGRVSDQRRYTQAFHDANAAAKWQLVSQLEPKIGVIKQHLQQHMTSPVSTPKLKQAAGIASIIAETGLRPTDDKESVQHGHFGVSSLQARHIKIKGGAAQLKFVGKEGVVNRAVVKDPHNVALLAAQLKGKGKRDAVFPDASGADANATLKSIAAKVGAPSDLSVKDLRTLKATQTARQVVSGYRGPPPPFSGDPVKDTKVMKAAILKMSGEVARVLNNTPVMARDNYIHPQVFEAWRQSLAKKGGAK